jgi:uncharacterized protein (DUF2235 family)
LPKRLVVFADGTGNAFGGRASNIWRLYEALDKRGSEPTKKGVQLARYVPGVGTSSIGLIRVLDGATGLGVPNNVRKLYRFLCWNWEPGDEIWMFGFSRGAFTVRTLAGMIKWQGLMPREVDCLTVTTSEMARNAKGAWRAYRQATAPFRDPGRWSLWRPSTWKVRMSPTVSLARAVRDACVRVKRGLLRQPAHDAVLKIQEGQSERCAGQVKIRFLGVFDTVEAYGVPLEDVRATFDFWLWPISFRNRVCSGIVENARHALSLDDERRTFHPLRFDQTDGREPGSTDIKELWFAGVHSDIGGGYPDDEASLESLIWIADEASRLGLEFDAERIEAHRRRQSKNAHVHDSRSGMKSAYRYTPRPVGSGKEFGGRPIVHRSVVQKIIAGGDGYSPVTLGDDFELDDRRQQISLRRDPDAAEQLQALVFWRRIVNLCFITTLIVLLAFPLIDEPVAKLVLPNATADQREVNLPGALASVIPGFVEPWLKSFWANPILSGPVLVLAVFLFVANSALRDRIKDKARDTWSAASTTRKSHGVERLLFASARLMQSNRAVTAVYRFGARVLVPLFVTAALIFAIFELIQFVTHVSDPESDASYSSSADGSINVAPGGPVYIEWQDFPPQELCRSAGACVRRADQQLAAFGALEIDVARKRFQVHGVGRSGHNSESAA